MNDKIMTRIDNVSPVQRTSLHESITPVQVSRLVDRFYERVLADARLGPIFRRHAGPQWNRHLGTMKSFWRSVLLRSGEYKGKPVPVHQRINGIGTGDFERWLALFQDTTAEVFSPAAAPLVNAAAARIATSLWLARNADPFAAPPTWSIAGGEDVDISC